MKMGQIKYKIIHTIHALSLTINSITSPPPKKKSTKNQNVSIKYVKSLFKLAEKTDHI